MSKRFGDDGKPKIRLVAGEFDIIDGLGRKTCRAICDERSSDVGEKMIE